MKKLLIISVIYCLFTTTVFGRQQLLIKAESNAQQESLMNAAQFYKRTLRLDSGANLIIHVDSTLSKQVKGYTHYEEKAGMRNIQIRLSNAQSEKELLVTLAHEMIHAKQFLEGQLVCHGAYRFSWEGQEFKNILRMPYEQRAWEKEAIGKQYSLYRDFRRAQKKATL